MPGNPFQTELALNPDVSAEDIRRLEEKYGLNKPLPVRYTTWLWNALHSDFGQSLVARRSVMEMILERLPNTLTLAGSAFLISLAVGVPLGIYSALHRNTPIDNTLRIIAAFAWTGNAQQARGLTIQLKRADYVLAARALGGSNARTIFRHIVPNIISLMIVLAGFDVVTGILAETGLSFIGLAIRPPLPSWGNMLTNSLRRHGDTATQRHRPFLSPRLRVSASPRRPWPLRLRSFRRRAGQVEVHARRHVLRPCQVVQEQ